MKTGPAVTFACLHHLLKASPCRDSHCSVSIAINFIREYVSAFIRSFTSWKYESLGRRLVLCPPRLCLKKYCLERQSYSMGIQLTSIISSCTSIIMYVCMPLCIGNDPIMSMVIRSIQSRSIRVVNIIEIRN
jgi:hypothetical protein